MGESIKEYHYQSQRVFILTGPFPLKQKFRLITAKPEDWDLSIFQRNATEDLTKSK
jgi:hypothetical protein